MFKSKSKLVMISLFTMCAAVICCSQAYGISIDDFSTDTTGNYTAHFMPYCGGGGWGSGSATINYDSSYQRAILRAEGGYNWTVMTRNGEDTISASQDFVFSADVAVLSEYVSGLYLGDWRGREEGTSIKFTISTYSDVIFLQARKDGDLLLHVDLSQHSGTSANLRIERQDSIYSFFCNDNLEWEGSFAELNETDLYFGAMTEISSGPSNYISQTAVDNWNFAPVTNTVPEPGTIAMLALGALGVFGTMRRMKR